MTELIISRYQCDALEKWLTQNKAQYTGDFVEGCLLDNYVVSCKRGFAAVYEDYINANSSGYKIVFAPYKDHKSVDQLWSDWYDFKSKRRDEK